jgi:aryl-alcohol dehydrogenase-like predicted oxidoreductase
MPIAGHATPEGTARYRDRFAAAAAGHFRSAEGLAWSSIGIGTYLGDADEATDRLVEGAVASAARAGVNVVDTAVNYRYERGERSVGQALAALTRAGEVARDEVIVCTKGGYLPNPAGRRWFESEYVGRGPDSPGAGDLAGDSHCMHPAYLAGEIERSRRNLGLEVIDLYYLHNPESQLRHVDRATFDARLEAAFRALETAVRAGRIRAYGIASWSAFRVPPGRPGHVSLARAKEIAGRAAGGGPDHFRFIQLPVNLMMPEALRAPTQTVGGEVLPAIPAAGRLGLHAVASAAIAQAQLKEIPAPLKERLGPGLASGYQQALQFTRSAPGLVTALVGMKQPAHVAENLSLVGVPPLSAADFAGPSASG